MEIEKSKTKLYLNEDEIHMIKKCLVVSTCKQNIVFFTKDELEKIKWVIRNL